MPKQYEQALKKAFTTAFEEGCGIPFEKAVRSARYCALRKDARSLFLRLSPATDEGIALRAGHLAMGELFNCLPEAAAIARARTVEPVIKPSIKYRPLIQYLGEELVTAARRCLPENVRAWAEEWRTASIERQIEISRSLYFLFSAENRKNQNEEIHTDNLQAIMQKELHKAKDTVQAVLPNQYGPWSSDNHAANCQGYHQMLAAFGRLAGAAVMVVDPIRSARDVVESWRMEVIGILLKDIREHVSCPDSSMMDSFGAEKILHFYRSLHHNYHVATALQLHDGRWVLLDPHALDWGIFSERYGMNETYGRLLKYAEALPGLSLIARDEELCTQLHEEMLQRVYYLLECSHEIARAINGCADLQEIVQTLATSQELDRLYKENLGMSISDVAEARELAAIMLFLDDPHDAAAILRYVLKPELLEERVGSIITFYHHTAIEQLKDQYCDGGILLHPQCMCSLPEYHIALNVVNSLVGSDGSAEFFLGYEFSEITLHNALLRETRMQRGEESEKLAQAAACVAAALPCRHPELERMLKLRRKREEVR